MKGARRYVITKITDRPRQRLEKMVDLREDIMKLSNDIALRVDALHTLIQNQVYSSENDDGLLEIALHQYQQTFTANKNEMERLVDLELQRIKEEMATALAEAKDLVERMGNFLGKSETDVKTFLENQKFEVDRLSNPARQAELIKEIFSEQQVDLKGYTMMDANLRKMMKSQDEIDKVIKDIEKPW